MPIPKPRKGEDKDDFIDRCMADDAMQEYDEDQRAAICYRQWGDRAASSQRESAMARSFAHLVGLGRRAAGAPAAVTKDRVESEDERERDQEERDREMRRMEDGGEDTGESEDERRERHEREDARRRARGESGEPEDGEDDDGDDDGDREEMRGHSTVARARARERGRIAAILSSRQAALNLPLAVDLACNTMLSRDEAIAVLARSPAPAKSERAAGNPRNLGGGPVLPAGGGDRIQAMWGEAFSRVVPAMRRPQDRR